jgi:hypothetical protein
MTRCFVLAGSLLFAASIAAAQTHPESHPQGHHDGVDHSAIDPELHAALHALMHGEWHGTLSASGGASRSVDLKVEADHHGKFTLHMTGDGARLGRSTDLAVEGNAIRWAQEVSGVSCQASATVPSTSSGDPQTLKGIVKCEQAEMRFALQNTSK